MSWRYCGRVDFLELMNEDIVQNWLMNTLCMWDRTTRAPTRRCGELFPASYDWKHLRFWWLKPLLFLMTETTSFFLCLKPLLFLMIDPISVSHDWNHFCFSWLKSLLFLMTGTTSVKYEWKHVCSLAGVADHLVCAREREAERARETYSNTETETETETDRKSDCEGPVIAKKWGPRAKRKARKGAPGAKSTPGESALSRSGSCWKHVCSHGLFG